MSAGRPAVVGVVVPTHDRPELLLETLRSVIAQNTDAELDIVVVFDRQAPDHAVASMSVPRRRIRVLRNERTPGLAGARNSGVLAVDSDWVAFCDDDDTWQPGKLSAQLARARRHRDALLLTTAICVAFEGSEIPRLAGTDVVQHSDLLRSRMSMLHSSTFLVRRPVLVGTLGLVDESIPGSQNEDWDLLLRATRLAPVQHVDEPLVRVRWGTSSQFSRQWESRVESLEWMLDRHPDILSDRQGAARAFGQLAFGNAALGRRGAAARWAGRTLRRNWREPRALLAMAVAAGLLPAERVMTALHRHGRGV